MVKRPKTEENQMSPYLQQGQEEAPGGLQAGQPHLDLWENHGAANP